MRYDAVFAFRRLDRIDRIDPGNLNSINDGIFLERTDDPSKDASGSLQNVRGRHIRDQSNPRPPL